MTPRETWTDERLDDLNKKVDKGFADVDAHFDRFERSVAEGFARVDGDIRELRVDMKDLRREMNERFDAVDKRFDSLNRTLILAVVGSNATIVAALIGISAF